VCLRAARMVKMLTPVALNFKWNGEHYRFSLERQIRRIVRDADGTWRRDQGSLGHVIDSKTGAEQERDRLRSAIREGTLQEQPEAMPQRDTLTLAALMAAYRKQHIAVHRADTIKNTDYVIGAIMRTELERFGRGAGSSYGTNSVTPTAAIVPPNGSRQLVEIRSSQ
jgi:hypothetical protein